MNANWPNYLAAGILAIIAGIAASICLYPLPQGNAQLIGNIVTGLFSALTGGAAGYAAGRFSQSPQSKDPST